LADVSKFGTGDDDSNPATGKYYMSDNALPWAINLPVKFDYPAEKEDITKAFLKFNDWVASRGFNYMDWYQNKNGYRQASKLY
jgi:LruC domain-containing protein